MSRRSFVGTLLGAAALAAVTRSGGEAQELASQRQLGKTGVRVFPFGLGGEGALEDPTRFATAVEIVSLALELGVNYIDTSPLYGDGSSERAIGEVVKNRRSDVFLASKTHDRSYDGSMRLLESSLRRLQTDHLDLWQVHNIQTMTDVDFILAREGAARALRTAREQGMVRYIGVTGHRDPGAVRRAIMEFPFDTLLLPLNPAEKFERSFKELTLPVAVEREMGIVAMKVTARGKIFRDSGVRTMAEALRYVLTLPVHTAIVGISSVDELRENVQLARDFVSYTPAEMTDLEERTRAYFTEALWFRDQM